MNAGNMEFAPDPYRAAAARQATWRLTAETEDGDAWSTEILNVKGGMEEATKRAAKIVEGRWGAGATGIKTLFVGITLPDGALDIGVIPPTEAS